MKSANPDIQLNRICVRGRKEALGLKKNDQGWNFISMFGNCGTLNQLLNFLNFNILICKTRSITSSSLDLTEYLPHDKCSPPDSLLPPCSKVSIKKAGHGEINNNSENGNDRGR